MYIALDLRVGVSRKVYRGIRMRYIYQKDVYETDFFENRTDVVIRLFKGKPKKTDFKKDKIYEIINKKM